MLHSFPLVLSFRDYLTPLFYYNNNNNDKNNDNNNDDKKIVITITKITVVMSN